MELEIGPGPEPGSFVVRVAAVGRRRRADRDDPARRRRARRPAAPRSRRACCSSSVLGAADHVGHRGRGAGRRACGSSSRRSRGDIRTAYRTSIAVAAERGKGVQIALRLDAPGLAALPWEALFDPETQAYLCRKEPLVRHVPAPYSPRPSRSRRRCACSA